MSGSNIPIPSNLPFSPRYRWVFTADASSRSVYRSTANPPWDYHIFQPAVIHLESCIHVDDLLPSFMHTLIMVSRLFNESLRS